MKIRYRKHSEIDKARWDHSLRNSINSRIYGFSAYLDIAAGTWDALVYDDYSAIMPLCKNTKYGISYIYQPLFTQQTGIFSLRKLSQSQITDFLNAVPRKFKLTEINLNADNQLPESSHIKARTNLILKLSDDYETIRQNFSSNTKRNINKARKKIPTLTNNLSIADALDMKRNNLTSDIKDSDLRRLEKLLQFAKQHKDVKIYGALNAHKEIISAVAFTFSGERAYYPLAASSEDGFKNRAAFALVDAFIRDHAGTDLILDFEGSEIPGVARFFRGFGTVNEPYFRYTHSWLPKWMLRFRKFRLSFAGNSLI
jgi:hypothetical protein